MTYKEKHALLLGSLVLCCIAGLVAGFLVLVDWPGVAHALYAMPLGMKMIMASVFCFFAVLFIGKATE